MFSDWLKFLFFCMRVCSCLLIVIVLLASPIILSSIVGAVGMVYVRKWRLLNYDRVVINPREAIANDKSSIDCRNLTISAVVGGLFMTELSGAKFGLVIGLAP